VKYKNYKLHKTQHITDFGILGEPTGCRQGSTHNISSVWLHSVAYNGHEWLVGWKWLNCLLTNMPQTQLILFTARTCVKVSFGAVTYVTDNRLQLAVFNIIICEFSVIRSRLFYGTPTAAVTKWSPGKSQTVHEHTHTHTIIKEIYKRSNAGML